MWTAERIGYRPGQIKAPAGTLISDMRHGRLFGCRIGVPARLAGADGGSRVVARVVETPWTGSATRDAARHCDASSSAHAGLHGRSDPPEMGAGLLITQRSRVQIPPRY